MPAPPSQATTPQPVIAQCSQVLAAIARITEAESSELMRQRLTEALARLFPVCGVRFLTPGQGGRLNQPLACEIRDAREQPLLIWDNEPRRNIAATGALARCLEDGRHGYPAHSPNLDYFPIVASHGVIEILEIRQSHGEWAERELFHHVMQVYANFVRVLNEREVDQLTGIYNRGAFDSQLHATAQSLRNKAPARPDQPQWWLLMLDVDHFKPINDRYGHLIGDEVLHEFAQLMKDSFRGVDRLYRFGGEEFAVLLSPCSARNAMGSAERMRMTVERHNFSQVGHVTVSGGLAPVSYDHIANIIGRADQAMYQAKRAGRNRTHHYATASATSLRVTQQAAASLSSLP